MAELWDLYTRDELGNFVRTGKTAERGTRLPDGTFHLVVHVWLENSEGKYLISQRCEEKTNPLKWEPTGGSALAGESSVEAACREVSEELGIYLSPDAGIKLGTGIRHYDGCDDFVDVWLFKGIESQIESLKLQKEEVKAAFWFTADEIQQMASDGKWILWDQFNYLDRLPFADHGRTEIDANNPLRVRRYIDIPLEEKFDIEWNWYQLPQGFVELIDQWRNRLSDLSEKKQDAIETVKATTLRFDYNRIQYYPSYSTFGINPECAAIMAHCEREIRTDMKNLGAYNICLPTLHNDPVLEAKNEEEKEKILRELRIEEAVHVKELIKAWHQQRADAIQKEISGCNETAVEILRKINQVIRENAHIMDEVTFAKELGTNMMEIANICEKELEYNHAEHEYRMAATILCDAYEHTSEESLCILIKECHTRMLRMRELEEEMVKNSNPEDMKEDCK